MFRPRAQADEMPEMKITSTAALIHAATAGGETDQQQEPKGDLEERLDPPHGHRDVVGQQLIGDDRAALASRSVTLRAPRRERFRPDRAGRAD